MKLKAGIIGGAGYTGGELMRLLIRHPDVSVSFINSRSQAGQPVHAIHHDLLGETDLQFTGELNEDIDVLFLCVGHGEARQFLEKNKISEEIKIIDLSNDFRLNLKSEIANRKFIYGLPELNKEKIRSAKNIANPGCFATAIQLGLLPLAKEGLLKEIYTTGITGSTGAGQSLTPTSQFSWRSNNIQAYKTLTHQHVNEIHQSLHQLQKNFPITPLGEGGGAGEDPNSPSGAGGGGSDGTDGAINFVPWRGDFTRGIFISSQLNSDLSVIELTKIFEDYYADHPFTFLSKEAIFLKQVVNTNKCVIQLEKVGSKLVVHSTIDNLLKGASGQAVQNMNLMFGLDECAGLQLKASAF